MFATVCVCDEGEEEKAEQDLKSENTWGLTKVKLDDTEVSIMFCSTVTQSKFRYLTHLVNKTFSSCWFQQHSYFFDSPVTECESAYKDTAELNSTWPFVFTLTALTWDWHALLLSTLVWTSLLTLTCRRMKQRKKELLILTNIFFSLTRKASVELYMAVRWSHVVEEIQREGKRQFISRVNVVLHAQFWKNRTSWFTTITTTPVRSSQ